MSVVRGCWYCVVFGRFDLCAATPSYTFFASFNVLLCVAAL